MENLNWFEKYTADTVSILGYLADELPPKAGKIFRMAEDGTAIISLPGIVVGETLFILLKVEKKSSAGLCQSKG